VAALNRHVPPHRVHNVLWPVQRTAKGWHTDVLGKRYAAALGHLLETPRGAYPWAPDFGTNLQMFRGQPYEPNAERILFDIRQAILKWLPAMSVTRVQASNVPSETLNLQVTWGLLDVGAQSYGDPSRNQYIYGPQKSLVSV